ncbi:hypothetical protein NTP67_20925 [Providencia rettgeri]|uniref:hypothetical protein n=1 Tax=Providencia rettgeri TaxID=587 RepID=UPI002220FB53|nr:hypothetical protein [Providencia rettgeri]ELU1436640.1 hypothetical protein [Providencia rettgeri]UYV41603.1 hypothetical protein NTP67_20925 [Providencia rettgeri]
MKLFILCNIAQYFKVINSNIYSHDDKILIIDDQLSKKQKNNIETKKVHNNVFYIHSSHYLFFKKESLNIIFYTYLINLRIFNRLRNKIFNNLFKSIGISLDDFNEVLITHETPPILAIVLYKSNISLLEDGKLNYGNANFSRSHILIRRFFRKEKNYIIGQSPNIHRIYATDPEAIPSKLKKTKTIKKLEVNYIASKVQKAFDLVLVTQQISECGYCKAEEKYLLYNNIIDIVTTEFGLQNIAVKYHPAEKNINYIKNKNVVILEKDIPFETINISKKTICISLFSSISHSNSVELININAIHKELKNIINSKDNLYCILNSAIKGKK